MNGQNVAFNENIFDRQVNALKKQSQQNMDARAALNYVRQTRGETGSFVQSLARSVDSDNVALKRADLRIRELTDAEIDRRALYDDSGVYNFRFTLRSLLDELTRCRTFNRPVTLMVVSINVTWRIIWQVFWRIIWQKMANYLAISISAASNNGIKFPTRASLTGKLK